MKRVSIDLRSLPAQMILMCVALVILTATAAGLPVLWLVRGELDQQAWSQVDQGSRAARALYSARQSELASLAALTAGRPTLRRLLEQNDRPALAAYMSVLHADAPLDLVAVCDQEGRLVAQASSSADLTVDEPCTWLPAGDAPVTPFYVLPTGSDSQAWLIAGQPVDGADGRPLGRIVAGVRLDAALMRAMEAETGLQHSLLLAGQPLVSSLADDAKSRPAPATGAGPAARETLTLAGLRYYAERFALSAAGPGLEAEVMLPVADLVATQRRLAWTVAAGVVVVALISSLLGALLAGRISRPLAHLAAAATLLSQGELERPLSVHAGVREVDMVAQALERARADLQLTLAELRQEKAWTDHLLESIVEGIVTLDRQGRVTFFSPGAERITGWRREQVLGWSCDRVFRPIGTAESFTQLIPAPGGQRKVAVELHDGRQALLSVTGARLLPPEGDNARVALVFRDVSEQEAVHRLLGDFLANVAHEFRTPLSAVSASAELLLDQAPDLSADELHELLTSLHLGIVGLGTLVDNLLESASIETGHFRVYPRPSSLVEIIAEAIRTMQPLLDKHGQRLVVELPASLPIVHADPRRIAQVLVNLLSNAAKYGRDGSEVAVQATLSEPGDRVCVSVTDQGPGIPAGERGALFRRFTRVGPDADKAKMGAGLGLSVVKAVVEAHGGQVGVDDGPSGGAVFWFTLPIASNR